MSQMQLFPELPFVINYNHSFCGKSKVSSWYEKNFEVINADTLLHGIL